MKGVEGPGGWPSIGKSLTDTSLGAVTGTGYSGTSTMISGLDFEVEKKGKRLGFDVKLMVPFSRQEHDWSKNSTSTSGLETLNFTVIFLSTSTLHCDISCILGVVSSITSQTKGLKTVLRPEKGVSQRIDTEKVNLTEDRLSSKVTL